MTLPTNAVAAVADAISVAIDDIAKPLLDKKEAQANDDTFRQDCQEISDALNQADTSARQRAIGAVASRMCIEAGHPVAGLGEDISVPMGFLAALLTLAAEHERDQQNLSSILHALNTK